METGKPGEDELVNLGRVLAQLHIFLRNGYDNDVACMLDPDFHYELEQYWTCARKSALNLKGMGLVVFATVLPYLYAHHVMDYPCSLSHKRLVDGLTEKAIQMSSAIDCTDQDAIRSEWILVVAPFACLCLWLLIRVGLILDFAVYHCCGADFLPGNYTKEKLKQILLFSDIGKTCERLKYTRGRMFNMVVMIYYALLLEFIAISVLQGSAVAALVGYAITQMFLYLAVLVLTSDEDLIVKIQGTLKNWPASAVDPTYGMIERLKHQRGGHTILATTAELCNLRDLTTLRRIADGDSEVLERLGQGRSAFTKGALADQDKRQQEAIMSRHSRKSAGAIEYRTVRLRAWATYPALKVYVADTGETVDLVKGEVIQKRTILNRANITQRLAQSEESSSEESS